MGTRRIGRGNGWRDGSGRGVRANRNTGGCRKGGPGHGHGSGRGHGTGRLG